MDLKDRAREFFGGLQDEICDRLGELEGPRGKRFGRDPWQYTPRGSEPRRGGGLTRVLEGGRVFEKGGVNLAHVSGALTRRLAGRLAVAPQPFHATGISLVLHPLSPMVPTVHMNLRYVQLLGEPENDPAEEGSARRAWFGGGADLTPCYLFEEDARHFHGVLRGACDKHDRDYYPRFKKWCDEYFHNAHRGEARGIGGIFFDYVVGDLERIFDFVRDVGGAFLEAYVPLVERRMGHAWWDHEREWQLIRRGRYVEFNLIHDRGTLFGLETQGRTESILMSLPPLVRWTYDHRPAPGSREAELVRVLKQPVDWAE